MWPSMALANVEALYMARERTKFQRKRGPCLQGITQCLVFRSFLLRIIRVRSSLIICGSVCFGEVTN
jgi:hypothetical protein